MGGQRLRAGWCPRRRLRTRPAHARLADVADLLWSMHQASTVAAAERDPAGRLGLAALGQAWEARNRRAFVAGYLGTPGIGGLVGPDRDLVRRLVLVPRARPLGARVGLERPGRGLRAPGRRP